jgi:hypothetical protein
MRMDSDVTKNLKASPFRAGMAMAYKPSRVLIVFGGALWPLVLKGC